MISVADAKEKFTELLSADDSWKNLSESQLAEHLAVFCAWALRDAQFKVERARQEFYVSTALNRSSVLAMVEDREYLPVKATPGSGVVSIKNNGINTVSIPSGTEFVSDSSITLTVSSSVSCPAGGSVVAPVSQKKAETYQFFVSSQDPFFECLLPSDVTSDVESFSVTVTDPDGETSAWSYFRLLQNAYSDSKAYDEFFNHLGQIGVRFGNGTFGLIPEEGSTVSISTWETKGNVFLAAGQDVFLAESLTDSRGNEADISVAISTAITGGFNAEGTSEIQTNLHYWPTYNEELVWDDDYVYFLKRRISGLLFCKAWGEEEAEAQSGAASLDYINKIFVTAYHSERDVREEVLSALSNVKLLNKTFEWVPVNHVEWSISLKGQVLPDVSTTEVEADIREALGLAFGRDSEARQGTVYMSEVYEIIRSTGYFESGTGARFEVSVSGDVTGTLLQDMVSLNLDNSTFDLTSTS